MKPINYIRMKMDDIHPEARRIAVAWVENYEKLGGIELEQKVKLGSDIMHFAMAYHSEQKDQEIANLKEQIEIERANFADQNLGLQRDIELLTEERDGLLRKCEELATQNVSLTQYNSSTLKRLNRKLKPTRK